MSKPLVLLGLGALTVVGFWQVHHCASWTTMILPMSWATSTFGD
jgi:hypothetical protein